VKFLKRFALPMFGLVVGVMCFFPWNDVRDLISTQIQKASGVQVQMQSFSPTIGLRLGLSKGSLLAFSADKASIRLPTGNMVLCDELIIGPRFLPFLLGKAQVSIGCFTAEGGQLKALTSASPFWSPSAIDESVELNNFSLENLELNLHFQGVLSGSVEAANIKLQDGGIPDVSWQLSGKKVRTPEANIPLLKLPGLDLGDLETTGSLSSRSIKVDNLKFGSADTLIQGKIAYNSDVAENFVPNSGEISGSLRVDPSAEKGSLRDVPWKTFGAADDKGQREFKRSFTGGIQNLFFSLPGT
jgi:hypothetical protein